MSNVIGFGQTAEERETNWAVLRGLKEDIKDNSKGLVGEKDQYKASERIEDARHMYTYFLRDYLRAA